MHRLSTIRIENHKSIIAGKFPLAKYTPLVGYNNAGKTNLLQAVAWIVKKSSLPKTDFYNPEKPIVITAEISGITAEVLGAIGDKHRPKIEPLVANGKISIRRTQNQPDDKVAALRLEVLKTDDTGNKTWQVNPAGIDAAISHLFPEPIFVGAMENATEDVGKFAASTTIGKLIREIIGPITDAHSGPVTEALAGIAKKLSAEGEEKDATLVKLDNQIQAELVKFFPGVSAKTHIPTPEFSDFLKGATIKIFEDAYDNPNGRDASSFGHGAQRAVQIALIKCLSEIKRQDAATSRTTLLLIDEPELYLHPQAIEVVRASLSRLSAEGYQVLFSSHSPGMISRQDAPKALLIKRNSKEGTHAYPRIEDVVEKEIADADHQAETLFSLTNSSKVLFSETVILAEGKTERALLPDIFSHLCGATLDEKKIGLVELGGVDNVANAMKVLGAMGIPTKAIVDLDFAFRGAVTNHFILDDNDNLAACKKVLERLEKEGKISTDDEGLPIGADGVSASKAFAIMACEPDAVDHLAALHTHLLSKNIWCWVKGAIENHLDLPSKKPKAHMDFLNNFKTEGYCDKLSGYDAVKNMITWTRPSN